VVVLLARSEKAECEPAHTLGADHAPIVGPPPRVRNAAELLGRGAGDTLTPPR